MRGQGAATPCSFLATQQGKVEGQRPGGMLGPEAAGGGHGQRRVAPRCLRLRQLRLESLPGAEDRDLDGGDAGGKVELNWV